jgi:butyrate kinase
VQQLILAINPGSTSTKIAVYRSTERIFIKSISHSAEDLKGFNDIASQFKFRMQIILDELHSAQIDLDSITAIMGRGGLVKPIPSGVYAVNESLKEDLRIGIMGQHASNLGGLIADEIASHLPAAKAYIVDPVVVDEFEELARISGHPAFERKSIFHALNQKAIARNHAKTHHLDYNELNLIVCHMGGGISVGAHKKGKVVDVNQALDGDGPFSPERSGSLPMGAVLEAAFSGKYTLSEMKKMLVGKGGYMAYLNTNDAYKVETDAKNGDDNARLIQEAMAYQVAKEIGAMATVLHGDVNAILLTGGIAYGKPFINMLSQRIQHIGRIFVYPGEDEMRALAMNGLRVIMGEAKVLEY